MFFFLQFFCGGVDEFDCSYWLILQVCGDLYALGSEFYFIYFVLFGEVAY